MCTPAVAMGLQAAGTIYGMVGAQQQASAQEAQYNYQAQIAENNAKLAQMQAESQAQAGAQKAQQAYSRAQQVQAAQQVALSASGVDIAAGSPLDLLTDTERMGRLDKANLTYDAMTNTWATQQQAQDYLTQAGAYRTAAVNAGRAGKQAMFGTLLSGASSVASQYNQFKQVGAVGQPMAGPKQLTPSVPILRSRPGANIWEVGT